MPDGAREGKGGTLMRGAGWLARHQGGIKAKDVQIRRRNIRARLCHVRRAFRGVEMIRAIFVLVVFLFASSAMAQGLPHASIELEVSPAGVIARYKLDRPATTFEFSEQSVARVEDLSLQTPNLTLTETGVSGGAPFDRFDVKLIPLPRERDGRYPALFKVGDGVAIYLPILQGDPARWKTSITIKPPSGSTILPDGSLDGASAAFVGPVSYLKPARNFDLVAAPDLPDTLRSLLHKEMAHALTSYRRHTGLALQARPLVIAQYMGGNGYGQVGDVTPGPTTMLRFYGEDWLKPKPAGLPNVRRFIGHEVFHFWNAGLARPGDAPSWLHEGGADYAADLISAPRADRDAPEIIAALNRQLVRCQSALQLKHEDAAIESIAFLDASVRYSCGAAMMWAADLAVRGASGGKRTIFNVWAEVIRTGRTRPDGAYTLADFTKQLPGPISVIELLTKEPGPGRWPKIAAAFNLAGAEISMATTLETRRFGLLFHLLGEVCPKDVRRGFFTDDDGTIRLDSPASCQVVGGSPVLTSIEGQSPAALSPELYARVQDICAQRGVVKLRLDGARDVDLPCTRPLAHARETFVVNAWR